ncbi:putative nitrate reductase [Trypanosoma grayi]|uniref:putative nitrate reductase n=1 Tax=Trypanosoma grayi TaxID=71804 RepID=UPI0004F49B1E|nr:putative nitrate reductase [Trypanosoma grayi]KEG09378.1 putative nitrate reductase [Trypanosoma grayi]
MGSMLSKKSSDKGESGSAMPPVKVKQAGGAKAQAAGAPAEPQVPANKAEGLHPPRLMDEAEVQRLIKEEKRVLLLLHGGVYDVTDFVPSHPGGSVPILSRVGTDAGDVFNSLHSKTTKKSVGKFLVGYLPSAESRFTTEAAKEEEESITPPDYKEATVLDVEEESDEVKIVRLACPEPLRLLPGGHVGVLVPAEFNKGNEKENHYTPFVSTETDFTLAVKKYPNGAGSVYIHSLTCGQKVRFRGPIIPLWVLDEDKHLQEEAEDAKHVLLVAGGVGLTPLFAMAAYLLSKQKAAVTLVGCYQDPEHIVLRKQVAALVADYSAERAANDGGAPCKSLQVHYVFSRTKETPEVAEANKVHLGRFGPSVLKCLTRASCAVVCGPPPFTNSTVQTLVDSGLCADGHVHVV